MADFSHLDETGLGSMVDVTRKEETTRTALVSGEVRVSMDCTQRVTDLVAEEIMRTARIAALNGAKQTSNLIPYCHQINLSKINVEISFDTKLQKFLITTETKTRAATGVEMEALTAASIAGLTIYDMIKAVDPGAVVGPFKLSEKTGGKSGPWAHPTKINH